MKRLLVFPGLSSPHHEKYVPVYDLLRKECAGRNIEMRLLTYPGQQDSNGNISGDACPRDAIDYALGEIANLERSESAYTTFSISWGCSIAMAVSMYAPTVAYWKRAVIWAPVPHWRVFKSFGGIGKGDEIGFGTRVCDARQDFMVQSIPNEYLIQHAPIPVTVGLGADDPYVTKPYLDYLQTLCSDVVKPRTFAFVNGCGHNVRSSERGVADYINFIFED